MESYPTYHSRRTYKSAKRLSQAPMTPRNVPPILPPLRPPLETVSSTVYLDDTTASNFDECYDSKMPYYVVPVLYVPKRVMPSEDMTQSQTTATSTNGKYFESGSKKPSMPTARYAMKTDASYYNQHFNYNSSGTSCGKNASFLHFNKRWRSTSHTTDPNLTNVEEENEHAEEIVIPTRDVDQPKSKKAATKKRDNALREIQKRLTGTLEMIENYQKLSKEMETKSTQYEHNNAEGVRRSFDHVSHLESTLRRKRK